MTQVSARWGRHGHFGRPGQPGAGGSPGPGRHFGQREQWVVQALSDRSAWAAVDDTAAAVSAVANGAWPYAMLVRPQTVTALLAGPTPPWPPAPWQSADRGWLIDRGLLAAAGDDGSPRPSDTFVALGSCDGGALLVDLAYAPTVISITGDPDAARDLMWSLVAQLRFVPRNRVHVAAGPSPGALAATPDRLPDPPGAEASTRDDAPGSWSFFVCTLPTAADVIQLRARAADAGRMLVLVLGGVVGSRWSLVAEANGEVTADGLGLAAWSGPISQGYPAGEPSTPPPGAPLTPRSSASPGGAHPDPRHAKQRTPSRTGVPLGERLRSWRRSPDFDDDDDVDVETWISQIAAVNPFAREQDGPSDPFASDS